jgi:hypothetical protein
MSVKRAVAPPDDKKNLILVAHEGLDWRDLKEICLEIVKEAPDLAVHLVSTRNTSSVLSREAWSRPTITVSFGDLENFVPARGRIYANRQVTKLDQLAAFNAAGIRAPRTERFEYGKSYGEADWGELVVLKPLPLMLTSKGGNTQLIRTRNLAGLSPKRFPPDHALSKGPALIQQFIDTGTFAISWRVLTLFGAPLYCFKSTSPIARPDLTADDATIEAAIVEPKHPRLKAEFNYGDFRRFETDPEIMEFAARIYKSFPGIPLQGCDILRECTTGDLYAIEINAGGNTWHFSSKAFARNRELLGGKDAFVNQLDAWKVAARALIEQTRREAS